MNIYFKKVVYKIIFTLRGSPKICLNFSSLYYLLFNFIPFNNFIIQNEKEMQKI